MEKNKAKGRRTRSATEETLALGRRIDEAIRAVGMTPSDLAKLMGEDRQSVYSWIKTGRIAKYKLSELARVTAQSVGYYLGTDPMTAQEVEEFELVKTFRELPDDVRQALMQQAKGMLAALGKKPTAPPGKKPKS